MRNLDLYPLSFGPILKRLVWGGRRLGTMLNKRIGEEADYAECWEIADHRAGTTRVDRGNLAGATLRDLMLYYRHDLLGDGCAGFKQFPLLVKFLDAHQNLSVQVHPNDTLGRELVGDNGKTEAWVILHAEPGSQIYAGLHRGVTARDLLAAARRDAVGPLLHSFEARAGDCVLIPAGTVHAIGAGIVLAEIQQMSDATFRIHDWGRVGSDGHPRELHLTEAIRSIDFDAGPIGPVVPTSCAARGGRIERIARCDFFHLERISLSGAMRVGRGDRFTILVGLGARPAAVRVAGTMRPLGRAETLLLPAALGECEVAPLDETAEVLACTVPMLPLAA